MMRVFIPVTPGKVTPRKLDQMRRALLLTMQQDLRIFGRCTPATEHLRRRIVRAKEQLTAAKPGGAA